VYGFEPTLRRDFTHKSPFSAIPETRLDLLATVISVLKRNKTRGSEMILSQDLHVAYKWRQEPVLKGVNCSFNRKSLILGPNGSGKTILFRAIFALTNVQSGKILIDERAIEDVYATQGILATNFPEVFSLISVNVYGQTLH
jgi:ABC-type multidrug transport system fused ATPase/permease subunit